MSTTVDLLASTVTDSSAALLNDAAKTKYTFAVLLPYLNVAIQELQELFQANNIPTTEEYSAVLPIDANVSEVTFSPTVPIVGVTYLPNDLIEPIQIWERPRNTNPWTPMTKRLSLPLWNEGAQINQLLIYVWESNKLLFMAANADNDIKIQYLKRLFTPLTTSTDNISVINAASFLEYRTAALAAEFIMQDLERAQGLNNNASTAIDRALNIPIKGKQNVFTRRRPFRQGYKSRSYI